MPPMRLVWELVRVIGPKLWILLVEDGRSFDDVKVADLLDEAAKNRVRRMVALERLRRKLPAQEP